MADYKYAYNGPEEGTAKAVLIGAAISTKTSIEMSKHLKGKDTEKAKALLNRIIKHEEALPYTRFTNGLGHKSGKMASGRYPEKASKAFLQLIESAEANASQAGLASELKIVHLMAHQASRPYHYGRLRRRQVKATHVEIVIKEVEGAKKKQAKKSAPKKEDSKPAAKEETPKTTEGSPNKREEKVKAQESTTTAPAMKEKKTLSAQTSKEKPASKKEEPSAPSQTKETAQQ